MNIKLKLLEVFRPWKLLTAFAQICVLYCFSVAGSFLAGIIHSNFPGSLIGMLILFILLRLEVFPLKWVDLGGGWLLAELLLFFIPSVVAVMQYQQFFLKEGLDIFLIILISTAAVMASSGLTAELVIRSKRGKAL